MSNQKKNAPRKKSIRYAVVGLGHIAQVAVLPAFRHATKNSELVALVSDDPKKLKQLGQKYRVKHLCSYDQYDELLSSGQVDAAYIALPNNLHKDFSVRAAQRGIHVLCEKPMAVSARECEEMLRAANQNGVRLMIAYRLHFEEANLKAIKLVHSGRLGEPRVFSSVFTMPVREGNIRVQKDLGGGPVFDIGIYCINAARYIFREEPLEVVAAEVSPGRPPFEEVEESMSVVLRFPGERIASFTCSFGAASVATYQVVGTKGSLLVENAYGYADTKIHRLTLKDKTLATRFKKRDQFAPELLHFSECILKGKEPEPSGREGLIDVQIIEAIYRAAATRENVPLRLVPRKARPSESLRIDVPPVKEPDTIHVEAPEKDEAA